MKRGSIRSNFIPAEGEEHLKTEEHSYHYGKLMHFIHICIWSSTRYQVPNPDQMSAVLQLQRLAWSSKE